MAQERVQKILAQAGISSRRKAEELILEGSVTINGKTAQLGDKAEWGKDAIKVNGKLLLRAEEHVYIAFHKPKAVISMMADPEGRPTLVDYLNKVKARLFPIGRLDFMSEGLILLTNDGAFAELLQRKDDVTRVYEVKIKGHPTEEMMERMRRPVKVNGRVIRPHSVRVVESLKQKTKIEYVLVGGGTVDLKALFEERGFLVERVVRVAIGHLALEGLAPGEYRLLKESQAQALLSQPELGTRHLEERIQATRASRARVAPDPDEEMGDTEERPRRGRTERAVRGPRKDFGDRPERGSSWGTRPERADRGPRKDFGDRPERSSSWGTRPERADRGPRKDFGDRPERGPRKDFGDRPARGPRKDFGDRPARGPRKDFGDRPERGSSWGTRPERADRGPRKDFGDRPARGPRKDFGDRPVARGDWGARPERADRGPRKDFGDRPERGSSWGARPERADRGPRKDFGDRPVARGDWGARPERADRGPRKDFGDRPARGPRKDFGDRPPRGPRGPRGPGKRPRD